MRIAHRLASAVLAGSLLLGGASGVLAAKGVAGAHWAALGGQITNLSGNTFTLTLNPTAATAGTAANTVQVTLAANAKQQARQGTAGPLANGDYAIVVGTRAQTSFTANRVIYSATAFRTGRVAAGIRARHTLNALSHHTVRGTVQSSTATALTITTRAGKSMTFQLAATTNFRVNGQVSHTAPAFTSGQQVTVVFTVDKTSKQATATAVALIG
jgi:hypothetical protein